VLLLPPRTSLADQRAFSDVLNLFESPTYADDGLFIFPSLSAFSLFSFLPYLLAVPFLFYAE